MTRRSRPATVSGIARGHLPQGAFDTSPTPLRPVTLAALLALAVGLALPSTGQAQYKVVGPDGKVTYTDRPPPAGNGTTSPVGVPAAAATDAGSGLASLPFELRQVASRYPVTLYTSTSCEACDVGRQYLRQRGIPYREKVAGNNDGDALQRATGARAIPALTIGAQVVQGWSADSWGSYLDAAGYPRQSALPGNYRAPAPTPLVATAVAPAPAAVAPAPPPASPPPPQPTPGGIRF